MKQKLIDAKKYPKKCANCFFGRTPMDKTSVLCEKKGIVDPEGKCRHYQYDPLKRVPMKQLPLTEFKAEDFEL
ncbi:MAG: hypothetical protein IIX36_02755 [Clostridia bacterium]|nr:hypothetical protein [Clostridia bacterium]